MKSLFFFTEFYHPVQDTTGYYLTRIIHTADRCLDVPVNVCCAVPSHNGELPASWNLTVHRIKTTKYDKNKLFQRIIRQVLITWRFLLYALSRVKRGDTVFAVTNPAFLVPFLAILRKVKRFKCILLVYDVFPDNLVPAGLAKKDSLRYRLALRCFHWSYRAMDEIIVIGRDMEEVVRGKVGNRCRITQIPNWVDVNAITPQPKVENELICAHHLQDKTVFLFAGNLGRVQGIENLLNAISRTKNQSAAFLFVGDGASRPQLEAFIHQHPEKKVIHLGRLPMSQQQCFLNACDVSFVALDDAMYGLGVPSKSYFAMAVGKPLLLVADADSEIGRVVAEEDIGWIVPPNMPDVLAQKIDEICSMRDLQGIGSRAREVAERRFSEEVVLSRYSLYFRQVLGQNGASPAQDGRTQTSREVVPPTESRASADSAVRRVHSTRSKVMPSPPELVVRTRFPHSCPDDSRGSEPLA